MGVKRNAHVVLLRSMFRVKEAEEQGEGDQDSNKKIFIVKEWAT